jgi:hypothetical protein
VIIVECYKDRALIHRMGFPGDRVIHEFGRSRVLGRVEQKQKAVGIIDRDPLVGEPGCLKEYGEKDAIGKIKLLTRKDNNAKRLVEISPRLEDWLYETARRNKIPPGKFGLPDDPGELHSMSLRLRRNRGNFQRFLIAFNRANDDEINTFREWIKEAIE